MSRHLPNRSCKWVVCRSHLVVVFHRAGFVQKVAYTFLAPRKSLVMSDPELEAIRAARINQLQQDSPSGGEEAAKQAAEDEARRNLLATVLDTAARERRESDSLSSSVTLRSSLPAPPVARIALVSQDRARQIEAILLRMAQTGQLRGRVTEEQLIDLLEKVCVV